MALTQTQVSELYISLFGRASEGNGNTFWQTSEADRTATAASMLASDAAIAYFGDTLDSNQDFIEHIYANTLGKTVAEDPTGIAFWVAKLDAGQSKAEVVVELIDAVNQPGNAGVAQDTFNNKVAVSNHTADTIAEVSDTATFEAYIADVDETDASVTAAIAAVDADADPIVDPGVEGETFTLTASTDRGADFEGTSDDDTFDAHIVQNSFSGGVSNSLSSADKLDGGAGNDTLTAELVQEFFGVTGDNQIDVQPTTANIEKAEFEARDIATGAFQGNPVITVDAKKMTDIDEIGSKFSDGDLVIENLTTLESNGNIRNTADITVTMDHTDNFNSDNDASDLTVLFDEDYLLSGQTSQASANYFLLDEDAELNGNPNRLNRINVDGIRFVLGDADPTDPANAIEISDPDTLTAGTHDAFVAALQDELQALIADGTLAAGSTLTIDPSIIDTTGLDDGSISNAIPAIVLTTGDGTTVTPVGYSQVEDVLGNYDVYGQFSAQSETAANPITVNVELDKVGRDGEGGNLIIGGKDQNINGDSDVDQADGIAVFEIAVTGDDSMPSNLGVVSSTNQSLVTVNVSDHADWAGADLTIRDNIGGGQELTLINSTGFSGDFSLAMSAVTSQMALTTQFGGGNDSYDWMSVEADAVSSGKAYTISMGSGDDTLVATLDGDSVDALGESFMIDAGAGDDTVTLDRNDGANDGVSQTTMILLDNIDVNLGAGNDFLDMDNNFNAAINAGSGDDLVNMNGNGTAQAIAIGQNTGAQNFGSRVLYHAELTITFAGFEKTVDIITAAADGFVADQTTINTAVMKAIDADAVLSELLNYTLNDGTQQLTITPANDAATVAFEGANSFGIAIYQPTLVTAAATDGQVVLAAGDLSALETGFIKTTALDSDDFVDVATAVPAVNALNWEGAVNEFGVGDNTIYTEIERDFEDSRGAATDDILDDAADNYVDYVTIGTDSATGFNLSTIDMGEGSNDIVVMHSNDVNAGVLKFTGTFGKVSVVNWHNDPTHTITNSNQMGFNATDFTALLNNQIDPSATANTNSAVDVAVTTNIVAGLEAVTGVTTGMNNNNTAVANGVNVLRFNEDAANSETFENLTASTLVAALNNGGTAYGNIQDTTLDAAIAAGGVVIGGTAKHIIMVENSTNEGEYKIFYLESDDDSATNANGDFSATGALELGIADFGASINVLQVGSVTHTSLVTNLAAAIDAGASTFDYDVDGNGTVAGGEGTTVIDGSVVVPGNNAPVATDDLDLVAQTNVAVDLIVLDDDTDVDGDTVVFDAIQDELITVTTSGTGTGQAAYDVANGDIAFLADAAGTYTFDYKVTDGNGGFDTASASVTVTDATTGPVNVAITGATTTDAAASDFIYGFAAGNYAVTIDNFADGDVIDLPDAFLATAVIGNTDGTDGIVTVTGDDGSGNVIAVTLTGIAAETDATIFSTSTFTAAFTDGLI